MARMEFSGVEEVMNQLFAESERLERKAAEMLGEAGQVVVKVWQDAIEDHGHVDTCDMKNSVRASAVKKTGEAYTSSIYPHGRDRKKQSNAEKAFVLHYGTSRIRGDHFVDDAEERASEAAERAMEEIWTRD